MVCVCVCVCVLCVMGTDECELARLRKIFWTFSTVIISKLRTYGLSTALKKWITLVLRMYLCEM